MRAFLFALTFSALALGCEWDDRPDGLDPDHSGDAVYQHGASDDRMSPARGAITVEGESAASEALGDRTLDR